MTLRFTAAIVTVSDGVARGDREDGSGDAAESLLRDNGFTEVRRAIVPDEAEEIAAQINALARANVDLVVTTGGTGFGPRDVTPEATRTVIEREAPGLAELMRLEGMRKTPMAALSRGIAGTVARTMVLNLPGSPKGVVESLTAVVGVLPHALETLRGHTTHR
jgi:molybdenum cofactor synthesis domain-containing protein